jgi:tetratricopeptide (TPR) repeat protein
MLRGSKALKRMDLKSIKNLGREIGGNPRGIELLDKIAHEEFRRKNFSWDQLKELIPELHERIIQKPGAGDDFTPLFLDKLFTYLSKPQALLLDILAIYRNPVPEPAIKAHQVSMKKADRGKLKDLSLLECIDAPGENLYYVHRLTAHYLLSRMEKAVENKYHLQAAQYFENLQTEEGKVEIYDLIEARWHYLQVGEWDKAADITFSLENYLTLHGFPQWSMELLQELDIKKLDKAHQLVTYGRIGSLYQDFGKYDKSIDFHKKAYEIAKRNNDLKNSATALHQIGMIYEDKGDYDEALKQYQKSLKIKEEIGNIKGVSASLHQIGVIYQYKGDYDEALKQYQKAGKIFEKIGDINGMANSFGQIGRIYEEKGNYDKALKQYQKAKETFEKTGDIKGVSYSLHQIGMIYQYKGDYDEALKQYQKSLEIKEKIGDIPGLALSMGQMGKLYFQRKEFAIALELFIQAFLIFTKIGSPYANQARKDIAGTRENLPEEQFHAILKKFKLKPENFLE